MLQETTQITSFTFSVFNTKHDVVNLNNMYQLQGIRRIVMKTKAGTDRRIDKQTER